jgi:hypothetical protein
MPNIFIMRGVSIGLGPGARLEFDENGDSRANFQWQFQYELSPPWLKIALAHARDAQKWKERRVAAWQGTDDNLKASTLEGECATSMQAITAAGIAVDALYASVQPMIILPPTLVETWRRKRTPRQAQVSEVIRRAFSLGNASGDIVKQNVSQIFALRDLAVHPSARMRPAVLHPELNIGLEWRFETFRAHNACLTVSATGNLFWQLVHRTRPKNKKVQNYAENMRLLLAEVFPGGDPQVTSSLPSHEL